MAKTIYRRNPPPLRAAPDVVGREGGPVERRKQKRSTDLPFRVVLKAASLVHPVNCILRDRSQGGVRLEIERENSRQSLLSLRPPTRVEVTFCSEGERREGTVRWRDAQHLGIAFDPVPGPSGTIRSRRS